MKNFKKILKFLGWFVSVLFLSLYILFYYFTSPKSNEKVLAEFKDLKIKPILTEESFKDFEYRKLTFKKDTALPTVIFVHGTIGSCLDFKEYIKDKELASKANFISYDRVGYNYKDKNNVQESIAFEVDLLEDLLKDLPKEKVVLVGYSYGGPIALAVKNKYKGILLLAPAVFSKVEPMPWMINLYNWKITRWLVPPVWKQASKEKLSHKKDLQKFEKTWKYNLNSVTSIHGDNDAIVPIENSKYLETQFSKAQFELMVLKNAGHGLIWSKFDFIKQQLLNNLD